MDISKLSDEELFKLAYGGGEGDGQLDWSEVPGQMLKNAPASAGQFVGDMVAPFMDPVGTAETFLDIGKGIATKMGLADSEQGEATVDAIAQFFAERYGSMEALKQTLATDPVGALSDVATVLTGGGGAIARAPGAVGTVGRIAQKAGSAIDPINNAQRGAKIAVKTAAPIAGLTTGVGTAPFREAAKAGAAPKGSPQREQFVGHMRGTRPIEEPVRMAERAVSKLAKKRSQQYERGMQNIKSDRTQLDMRPVDRAYLDAEDMVYPYGVAKSKKAQKVLGKIRGVMDDRLQWENTPGQVDDLKQAIGEIRKATKQGTLERNVAQTLYNRLVEIIGNQAPTYASVMKDYSEASEILNELRDAMSVNDRASIDTTLRKLQSTMRNNVNTNYGRRENLINELDRVEPGTKAAIAGQALNKLAPRGIQSIVGSGTLVGATPMSMVRPDVAGAMVATAGTTSPRLMGEISYAAGKLPSKGVRAIGTSSFNAGRADRVAPDKKDFSKLTDEELWEYLYGPGQR